MQRLCLRCLHPDACPHPDARIAVLPRSYERAWEQAGLMPRPQRQTKAPAKFEPEHRPATSGPSRGAPRPPPLPSLEAIGEALGSLEPEQQARRCARQLMYCFLCCCRCAAA